ncbi:hypothetical protein [Guptibacillus hwajinpoensis]|uniref:hypothetical protein n=1 Tax=Guptibacillus hwajinpoensis TaxID=208199 RepID=UPI00384F5F48
MYQRLKGYLTHHQSVEIVYLSKENQISQRVVTLYVVNEEETIGFCHLRKKVRMFKTERILVAYPCQCARSKESLMN